MARRYKYYNNGIVNKQVFEGDPIPEGFVPGMKPKSEEEKRKIAEKRRKTNLERYGVENTFQSEEKKEKIKQTMKEKYGVEHPLQSKEFMNKAKDTMIERYGVEHALQSEELSNKSRNTNIERYGVEHALQSEELRDKIRQTNLERYGVENPMQNKDVQEKAQHTNIERYGVAHILQSKVFQDKARQTTMKNYGVEHPLQSKEVKNKVKQTNMQNLGVPYPFMSEEVLEKRRKTNIERYGGSAPLNSKEIREKERKTCQEKYGVDWPCQRPEAKQGYSNDSLPNREFACILEDNMIQYEREFSLGSYSYDFKVGNKLIEIDPTATHNTIWSPFGYNEGISGDYHQKKSRTAEAQGYQVIHIFDWDDINKMVNLLKSRETVYARKCKIGGVSLEDTTKFLNENHLQGSCRFQEVRIGLYYESKLISLMTFGRPRYNKNYEYELLRYATTKNVVGGAERLFKYFVSKVHPNSIISYCDRSKFLGKVYERIGFDIDSRTTVPSCHWYNPKTGRHLTDNLVRQRGFDQIFGTNYGKGTSNRELLINEGFLPVYDCGQSVYLWRNKQ